MSPRYSDRNPPKTLPSMGKYSALPDGEEPPEGNRLTSHIRLLNAVAHTLGALALVLVCFCIYLFLKLELSPAREKSLHELYGYTGSLPIQHDNIYGPYISCEDEGPTPNPADCSFDLLANGWVPSPCFDPEMHHDAVHGKEYMFFEDMEGTKKVHQDVVLRGNLSMFPRNLWVTFDEHINHCWYLLNGSIRATTRHSLGILDTWYDDEHMQHCFGLLVVKKSPAYVDPHVKAFFEHHRCYLHHV